MKNLIIAFFITCMIFIQLNAQNRCDKACLKELSNGVDFIQFIYNPLTIKEPIKSYYADIKKLLIIPEIEIGRKDIKIALIIPQNVIKSYSVVVSDSVFAYIFKRDIGSHIEIFYSGTLDPVLPSRDVSHDEEQGARVYRAPLDIKAEILRCRNRRTACAPP